MAKRKGAISIFLVLVLPVLIISVVKLYDALFVRQREEKALKVAYAVSEARLGGYNEYLKKEFSLFAHLETAPLEDFLCEYMDLNGFDCNAATKSMKLSDPKIFRDTVVRSAKGMFAKEAVDMLLKKIGIMKLVGELSGRLEKIENSFEKMAELLSVPASVQKMVRTSGRGALRNLISSARESIYENNSEFRKLSMTVRAEIESAEALKGDVEKTLGEAAAKYNEKKAEIETYIARIELLLNRADELARRCTEISDDIDEKRKKLEELLSNNGGSDSGGETGADGASGNIADSGADTASGNNVGAGAGGAGNGLGSGDGLDSGDGGAANSEADYAEIQRLKEEIARLEEEYEQCDSEYSDVMAKLDEVKKNGVASPDDGDFGGIIKKIRKLLKKIFDAFKAVDVDGKKLMPLRDYTLELGKSGDLFEKILITEWGLSVFGCYAKGEHKEDRAIKGELEYLASGEFRETKSMSVVKAKIAGIRAGANLVTFFGTDAKREIDSVFSLVPPPFGSIGKVIAYGIVVLGESYLDVQALLDGKSFDFIKKSSEWRLSMNGVVNEPGTAQMGKNGFGYRDYLRLLIYFEPDDEVLLRAMNLIEASIYKKTGESYSLSDFAVGHRIDLTFSGGSPLGKYKSFLTFENSYD